jgi:SNF2 family DNA or RNA helicase
MDMMLLWSSLRDMKYFYFNLPKNKPLHEELTSLYGVVFLVQYEQYAAPVFQFDFVFKTIFKYYPTNAKILLNSPRYKEVREHFVWLKDNIKNVNKTIPNSHFNFKSKLTPLPYQESGVEMILDRYDKGYKGALQGDVPGLGKTFQAILLYNAFVSYKKYEKFNKDSKVLIVCPNSVKGNWKKEWEKCVCNKTEAYIVDSNTPKSAFDHHNIFVINNDILHKHRFVLRKQQFSYVIIDEIHYFCNSTSKRSKVLRDICSTSEFVLGMSGTPLKNYIRDIRHILQLIDPDFIWGNKRLFEKTFCDLKKGKYGMINTGASNQRLLSRILKMHYLIRRTKEDIENQLPEKRREFLSLDVNESMPGFSSISKMRNVLKKEGFSDFSKMDEIPAKLKRNKTIQRARIDIGLLKVPFVVDMVNEKLKENKSVILFCYHKEVFYKYKEIYKNKALYISGGTNSKDRTKFVKQFQSGEKKLIVLSLDACSEGLTLTKSSYMVQSEMDWKAVVHNQAEDRFHRVGQTEECLVVYPYIEDTLDEYIIGLVGYKNKTAKRIVG